MCTHLSWTNLPKINHAISNKPGNFFKLHQRIIGHGKHYKVIHKRLQRFYTSSSFREVHCFTRWPYAIEVLPTFEYYTKPGLSIPIDFNTEKLLLLFTNFRRTKLALMINIIMHDKQNTDTQNSSKHVIIAENVISVYFPYLPNN